MKEYIIATNNKHKVEEIQKALGDKVKLVTLKELGCKEEIPETADAFHNFKYCGFSHCIVRIIRVVILINRTKTERCSYQKNFGSR